MFTGNNTLTNVSVLALSASLSACCGFMGHPTGKIELKKTGRAYDLIFSADCSPHGGGQGSVDIYQVVVTELPSNRVVCQLEGGLLYDWWRYGERVPGMSLATECAPLEIGRTYELRAHGWTVVVIEPSGEPRVVDASCEELIEA